MSEEAASGPEAMREINDKIAELEDLQLVNKLDIINVKNELDKASLSGGPSTNDMDKISEIRDLVEKSDKLKKAERIASELENMKGQLDKMKSSDAARLREDLEGVTKDIAELKKRMSEPGRKGVPSKGSASSEIAELRERIGKLETAKPGEIDLDVPEDIRDELSKINEKIAGMDKGGPVPTELTAKLDRLDKLSSGLETLMSSVEEQKGRLSSLESAMAAAPAKKGKAGTDVPSQNFIVDRIDRLEKKIEEGAPKPVPTAEGPSQAVVDTLSSDLAAIKKRVDGIERKAGKPVIDTSSVDAEIQKMKQSLPIEDISGMKEKMEKLERSLGKLSKLAVTLKPIELPAAPEGQASGSKELELRVKELERSVGAGVGEQRFRVLEKKMDEMKEWLPEYIDGKVGVKLKGTSDGVEKKVREMDALKKELITSTVEELLAQPGTVSKMIGDKLEKQVSEMREKMKKMDDFVKPSDAKLTSLLKELSDTQQEVARLRSEMKGIKSVSGEEVEDIGTELRALNTRMHSIEASVKGVESTGVTGVMRDLEILKTKADWLESTVHKLDLDKIYARIDEIENSMRASSASNSMAPIVIE